MNLSIKTSCAECGTPLWGVNLHRIGELYYCSADAERLSTTELRLNRLKAIELDNYKKMFDGSGKGELIINGSFATDSDWVKQSDVAITGGEAVWTNALNGTTLTQAGILIVGVIYEVVFTISNYTDGGLRAKLGGNLGTVRSALGTFTEDIQTGVNQDFVILSSGSGADVSINNVSLRRQGK